MISFSKSHLDRLASETGFLRDNLEKVMRLVGILSFLRENDLLAQALALKGGTAINLTMFEMPRLSVDIDLDFNINCSREDMLIQRHEINDLVMRYMLSEGYTLMPGSKSPFSLDSWVFRYTNVSGNPDNIKIEINYSDRCHALPAEEKNINVYPLEKAVVNTLNPIEIFASKINALVNRGAMRDMYDVYNMLENRLFNNYEERNLLRKVFVFYRSVGAMSKAEEVNLQFAPHARIQAVGYPQVRAQLMPMLRRGDLFDFERAKNDVLAFLSSFLQFDEKEQLFVNHFNRRDYRPEILFGQGDIAARVALHPMALWKCRPKEQCQGG